jgi:hypothetical protein
MNKEEGLGHSTSLNGLKEMIKFISNDNSYVNLIWAHYIWIIT